MDGLQIMKLTNLVVSLLIIAIVPQSNATELNLTFQQNDYQLYFEHGDLIRYNKKLVKEMHLKTFKYNRTISVTNASITLNFDLESAEIVIDVYKFVSNEYRFFGVHFQVNACKAFDANVGGIKTATLMCGNVIGCPLRKGIKHYFCNFYPDQSKLPPYLPNGQYKIDLQMLHDAQEAMLCSGFITVSRPIVYV